MPGVGPGRRDEAVTVATIVVAAVALRAWHVGGPGLWWDELVALRTASRPLADVVREVKWGIPPGAGNAGAMPLDYVLLHAWLAAIPWPAPAALEAVVRAPAFVWSCLTVPALWWVARRLAGARAAALAATILALSVPHALYAAEARMYALLGLATVGTFGAFAWILRAPRAPAPWAAFALAHLAALATGLFAGFATAAQGIVLAQRALRGDRRMLAPLVGCVLVASAFLAAWWAGTTPGFGHGRPTETIPGPARATWEALGFFALGAPSLRWAALVALPVALVVLHRRGHGGVGAALALLALAVPVIALVVRWKAYYFHPRHALFLLPLVALVVGVALARVTRRAPAALPFALVLAAMGPGALAFLRAPAPYFHLTKGPLDVKPFVADVARTLPPGAEGVVLAERRSPANAVLAWYLRWWRLADRVALRSSGLATRPLVRALRAEAPAAALALRPAVGLTPAFRRLLDLDGGLGPWPAARGRWWLLAYEPLAAPLPDAPDVVRRRYPGFVMLAPRAQISSRSSQMRGPTGGVQAAIRSSSVSASSANSTRRALSGETKPAAIASPSQRRSPVQ